MLRFSPSCSSGAAKRPSKRLRRSENVPGPLYVDKSCIDCDACRWMAPAAFSRVGSQSAVTQQPSPGTPERLAALQALISCPTYSIHIENAAPGELAAARDSFPLAVPGTENVFHLGHHDESSYGAASYFITREGGGNIIVDVPRWCPFLAQRVKALGGAKYIFLTHRDDVSEHARWADCLGGATRIIHSLEVNKRQGTDAVEWQLTGDGPWSIDDDVQLIFTPGHTRGCVSLLYKSDKVLFSGDHLAFSGRLQRLTLFRNVNWYSVPVQLESVKKLLEVGDFLHILPGHGRRTSFDDVTERDAALKQLLVEEGYSGG